MRGSGSGLRAPRTILDLADVRTEENVLTVELDEDRVQARRLGRPRDTHVTYIGAR